MNIKFQLSPDRRGNNRRTNRSTRSTVKQALHNYRLILDFCIPFISKVIYRLGIRKITMKRRTLFLNKTYTHNSLLAPVLN